MSTTLEIEEKTVARAVEKACQRLNISRKELQYDVLSYGSTGIFGLGRTRNARIRVRVAEEPTGAKGAVDERTSETAPAAPAEVENSVPPHPSDTLGATGRSVDMDDSIGLGRDVLQRIVDSITDDADIRLDQQTERIEFHVEGGNSAVLIGRHGQTLEAIQSLIEKVVNKNNHHRIRVRVDVGGYLQNRKKRLIRNAERLAQKCRRTKKPVTAGLLNAHDRRVVHLALKDTPSVRTRSTGDGPLRNLMILPSKSANGGQRKRQRRDS